VPGKRGKFSCLPESKDRVQCFPKGKRRGGRGGNYPAAGVSSIWGEKDNNYKRGGGGGGKKKSHKRQDVQNFLSQTGEKKKKGHVAALSEKGGKKGYLSAARGETQSGTRGKNRKPLL